MPAKSPFFARIKRDVLAIVGSIPAGRLVSFKDIAAHLDIAPRQAAYLLATLDEIQKTTIPWHRAVPDDGLLSTPKHDAGGVSQARLLEAEGVEIAPDGRILRLAARMTEVASLPHDVPRQARPANAPVLRTRPRKR